MTTETAAIRIFRMAAFCTVLQCKNLCAWRSPLLSLVN